VTGDGGHFYLTTNQTDERCFERTIDYKYCWVRMMLLKIEGDDGNHTLTYMGGLMENYRDVWKEFKNLSAGQYLIYVEMDWPSESEHTEFSVSSYGSATCYFLRDEAAAYEKENLLR
jgi:hypothetical protein